VKAILLASACAVAQLSAPTIALAQTTEGEGGLSEVVVTATRRAEKLQDVPLSITTLSQKELTARGIVGYEGLAHETPGVVLNRATANFNNFTARGIATNGYGANLQNTVAIYIDELPISTVGNTTVLDPNLYDVERIEFLRGPQGTLFGSGSLAGALRILTKSPDLTKFDASALVDFGMIGSDSLRQRYDGMVNIPLVTDKLALRVVGFARDEKGYIDNLGTGINDSNTLIDRGGRSILLWEPTERLSVRLLASYENSKPKDSSLVNPLLGRDKRISDRPDLFVGKLTNANATIGYQFNGANLTSSSTYSTFDQKFFVDLAGTFGGPIAFGLDAYGYQNTFVEEARLASDPGGKVDWVLGGFYLDRRHDVNYFYRSSPEYLAAHGITGLPDEYYQRLYSHIDSHELAGFGELTYHFTDNFWATGGLRYASLDAQTFNERGYNSAYLAYALGGISGPLAMVPVVPAAGVKAEASKPSYRASVSYRLKPSLTTYATVSTGFRSPVVNAFAGRSSVVDPNDLIIPSGAESDDLKNYELGVKGNWLNGKLSANLALYQIDWSDIQVQANRVSDSVQFATNIGAATSRGLEFEIQILPLDHVTVGLNGSFNDAKVTKLSAAEAAISGAVDDARLASPHFQGSLLVNYNVNLTQQAEGNLSFSVQHVGSFPGSFPRVPGKPAQISPTYDFTEAYTVVGSTFAVALEKFTVGVYVENLFDDRSVTYVHPEGFLANRYATLQPRTFGVRLGYDF
jgi:iron complex outermembrane receptor protein